MNLLNLIDDLSKFFSDLSLDGFEIFIYSNYFPILVLLEAILLLILIIVYRGRKRELKKLIDKLVVKTITNEISARAAVSQEVQQIAVDELIVEPSELFKRLKSGLTKTRDVLMGRFENLIKTKGKIDNGVLSEFERILVTSDIGVKTSMKLLNNLSQRAKKQNITETSDLTTILKDEIYTILSKNKGEDKWTNFSEKPFVIMVIGVNGGGKTTTIGKMAKRYTSTGKSVLLAAGDTFRAAASDQLSVWAERSGSSLVARDEGHDPSAVVFDAIQKAKKEGSDVVIADTAGRLHTKVNLMKELEKVKRVMSKECDGAPHRVLLVLDATCGQNAIAQARQFTESVSVTDIALTKLDGTAKGGVIVGIMDELTIPVRFIGVGEKIADLQDFDPKNFTDALFEK